MPKLLTKNNQLKPLTVKQQRFVNVYDGNATEAARLAGYKGSENTLAQIGRDNLRKPKMAKLIAKREAGRNKKEIADRIERQQFWTKILRKEMTRRGIIGKGEQAELVDIDPKFKDMLKASELLGRSEADFTDKLIVGIDEKMLQTILSAIPNKDWRNAVKEALLVYAKGVIK